MPKRFLVRTPRGLRSIVQSTSLGGNPSETFEVTANIGAGSTLVDHNKGVIVIEAYYEDDQGWWESLKANTEYADDPLNQVWIYSASALGTITLKLKS